MDKKGKLTDIEKLEWEFFHNHRNYLRQEKHNQENKFSQHLVYLAAGVFSFSSTFSTLFPKAGFKWLLIVSWSLSILSLVTILISFYFSIQSFKEEIECWDKEKKDCVKNCSIKLMKFFIIVSTCSLILSVIFLLIFYSLNY